MKSSPKKDIISRVQEAVSQWPGTSIVPHRFGGLEFQINGREFGHLHGDYQADIPFTVKIRRNLVSAGKASLHHLYPNSGWISYYVEKTSDADELIELLRLNYDRLAKRRLPQVDVA